MGQLYKVLKIDIFESCSWLGPLGVLVHQKKILTLGALIKAMSVQNLWVAQKCAFIGKSAIFTFFWSIFFFKFIRKMWENQFRGVRVLWAHSGATKLENQCFLFVFPILSPQSEPKVLLRPRIGLPAFF